MKSIYQRCSFFGAATVALLLSGTPAAGAKLYQLEYLFKAPAPTLPAEISVVVHEGENCNTPRGTSSETFNGNGNTPVHSCDAVACLTDTRIVNGEICIEFLASGYSNGGFKAESCFEIIINGQSTTSQIHTSCSQPLPSGPVNGSDYGTFEITGGAGSCAGLPQRCPITGSKIYELSGNFCIDLEGCNPTGVIFNVYKKDNELKGTSTADISGTTLSNIVCDAVACLTGAEPGTQGRLCINFDSFGYRSDGAYDAESSFEMILTGCGGSNKTVKLHTSCSRPFPLDVPYQAGDGHFTFTDGCGACVTNSPISVEEKTWGELKGLYHR